MSYDDVIQLVGPGSMSDCSGIVSQQFAANFSQGIEQACRSMVQCPVLGIQAWIANRMVEAIDDGSDLFGQDSGVNFLHTGAAEE